MTGASNIRLTEGMQDQMQKMVQVATHKQQHFEKHLHWLQRTMHPYFFITMKNDAEVVTQLAFALDDIARCRRMVLVDREHRLVVACLNQPGSLYETVSHIRDRVISYADFSESLQPLPGCQETLEVQTFEFDCKSAQAIAHAGAAKTPVAIKNRVFEALKEHYPQFDHHRWQKLFATIWLNNRRYVLNSPPRRVAQLVWLYQQCIDHDGIFFDVEEADCTEEGMPGKGARLFFGVGNPPQKAFLPQVVEVFNRFNVMIDRAYCLTINNGIHPYFLSTFYVTTDQGIPLENDSPLFQTLREELYNTQILSSQCETYRRLVAPGIMSGVDASLISALVGFCHTNLAHNHPDSFDLEGIVRAFYAHPTIALQLIALFRCRFDPDVENRDEFYHLELDSTRNMIDEYTTGRRFLDEFRRTIFHCALLFIRHTLKTNFYVREKHALAFRLDPAYLDELGEAFTADLPTERPFRISYFYGRFGCGYHIGFSDIARGGWRTLITQGRDDYVTAANTLFRENYVLAHTQHLKNKDIYEGGSKLVAVLNADGESTEDGILPCLYKLQFGFVHAFLDLFVTREDGRAADARVVDYYGEEEPIELGPDENMHDSMVELIAQMATRRGYVLGSGIMSSKKVGINHKEYGVTSIGVVKFAEIAMRCQGIDIHNDAFSVKLTGGPNGDVAGNAMKLLLERCPHVRITTIVDGGGALYDPAGADRNALGALLLVDDIDSYDVEALHPGGFVLHRHNTRRNGLCEMFLKVSRDDNGLCEEWITNDQFYREYNRLMVASRSDLFLPCGGRPETLDDNTWSRFFDSEGLPSAAVIVEGANSFITPNARRKLQEKGVVILRDASANKCGVISSSYEILANLMLTDREFLFHKERYVEDVIARLNQRASDEAQLIFNRYEQLGGGTLYTEISDGISREINQAYARLFEFFEDHPEHWRKPEYHRLLVQHLPAVIGQTARFRKRIANLPDKIKSAILASEIASSLVYHACEQDEFMERVQRHVEKLGQGAPSSK